MKTQQDRWVIPPQLEALLEHEILPTDLKTNARIAIYEFMDLLESNGLESDIPKFLEKEIRDLQQEVERLTQAEALEKKRRLREHGLTVISRCLAPLIGSAFIHEIGRYIHFVW